MADLKKAVGTVLEGWTLPHDVRKILETAYYADTPTPVQADHSEQVLDMVKAEQSLEVVTWYSSYDGYAYTADELDDFHGRIPLTDHAKATAALAQKDAEIALLVAERNLAWAMCDQLRARLNKEQDE